MATTSPKRAAAADWLRVLPSPMIIFVIALGGVLVAVTVAKGLRDPDFFWHVTVGELIATTGMVPSTDPFSFTWAGQPWTPHEWLSELLMYGLVEGLGRAGALIAFGLLPAAILAILAAMVARQGVGVLAFALPAMLIGLVITPYVTLRPQALSWLMLAGLQWFLIELRPVRPARVLWLAPLFALWANLHGVYVIGLGVVAAYLLFTLLDRTPMASAKRWVLSGAAVSLLASMLTPAGPLGILYPLRYVDAGDWGLAHIEEWQSPSFHEPAHLAFLALIVAVGLNGGRRTPGWLVMLSWVGIAMGLISLRNVPLAAVFALPTLAFGLEDRLRGRRERRARAPRTPNLSISLGRRVMELGTGVVIVIGAMLVLVPHGPDARIEEGIAERFPAAGIEHLRSTNPDVRVFAEYGWGGYAISQLYMSGGRVFVDGRNDMYDQSILEDYSSIRAAEDGWEQLADSYGIEAFLLPPVAPLVRGFAQDAGWCEILTDQIQVLVTRDCP
jgi:hypothetical protein